MMNKAIVNRVTSTHQSLMMKLVQNQPFAERQGTDNNPPMANGTPIPVPRPKKAPKVLGKTKLNANNVVVRLAPIL